MTIVWTIEMHGRYLPRLLDFFPKLRRGHGSTHGTCVNSACATLRRQEDGKKTRGESHEDQASNAADWKTEHGFRTDLPLEDCFNRVRR